MKRKKERLEQLEQLVETLQIALPPVVRGEWDTFRLLAKGCDVTMKWDDNCEYILLKGKITP